MGSSRSFVIAALRAEPAESLSVSVTEPGSSTRAVPAPSTLSITAAMRLATAMSGSRSSSAATAFV